MSELYGSLHSSKDTKQFKHLNFNLANYPGCIANLYYLSLSPS